MSRYIKQKISQSLSRIQTRTRSQRLCGGARRRRQALQPSFRCPMGADRPHTSPDVVPTSSWCECARDARQASDRFEECLHPDMHVRFHAVCVKSPSNITVRAKTKCSWDLWHINLTNTHQNWKALHTRTCTSRWITLGCFVSHSRKSASLARALNTFFCCRILSVIETCDANLVSTLLNMAAPQSIFFSQDQVVPGADGPEKIAKTTKQASSWVPLLLSTLVREHTFQNMIGIHFCYWCIVILWSGWRHFYVFSVFFWVLFSRGFAFFEGKKKFGLRKGVSH